VTKDKHSLATIGKVECVLSNKVVHDKDESCVTKSSSTLVGIDDGLGGGSNGKTMGGKVPKTSRVAFLCAPSSFTTFN